MKDLNELVPVDAAIEAYGVWCSGQHLPFTERMQRAIAQADAYRERKDSEERAALARAISAGHELRFAGEVVELSERTVGSVVPYRDGIAAFLMHGPAHLYLLSGWFLDRAQRVRPGLRLVPTQPPAAAPSPELPVIEVDPIDRAVAEAQHVGTLPALVLDEQPLDWSGLRFGLDVGLALVVVSVITALVMR